MSNGHSLKCVISNSLHSESLHGHNVKQFAVCNFVVYWEPKIKYKQSTKTGLTANRFCFSKTAYVSYMMYLTTGKKFSFKWIA